MNHSTTVRVKTSSNAHDGVEAGRVTGNRTEPNHTDDQGSNVSSTVQNDAGVSSKVSDGVEGCSIINNDAEASRNTSNEIGPLSGTSTDDVARA